MRRFVDTFGDVQDGVAFSTHSASAAIGQSEAVHGDAVQLVQLILYRGRWPVDKCECK